MAVSALKEGKDTLNVGEAAAPILARARAELAAHDPSRAFKSIHEYHQAFKKTSVSLALLGRVLERLDRLKAAQASYAAALKLNTGNQIAIDGQQRIDLQQKAFLKAKAAIDLGEFEVALTEMTAIPSICSSVRLLYIAQALDGLGRRGSARKYLQSFLVERPEHPGAKMLMERYRNDADHSDTRADPATAQKVSKSGQQNDTFSTRVNGLIIELERCLFVGASIGGLVDQLKDDIETLRSSRFQDDVALAKAAHFVFAESIDQAAKNYSAHLIEKSVAYDYITWPRRIQTYILGKNVLDVGCGFGAFGNGFLIAGAKSYTGCDPAMPMDSSMVKNKRIRKQADLGLTPLQIMELCPSIRLHNGTFESLNIKAKFDIIVLHNVTEHLIHIEEVFRGMARLLAAGGKVIFHHHNFYCWNGHHQAPNQVGQYDLDNASHRLYADWNHILISGNLPTDHYFNTGLNQIRLDQLRELTEKHFKIEVWQEINSPRDSLSRLSAARKSKLLEYDPSLTERDLFVNAVFGVCSGR